MIRQAEIKRGERLKNKSDDLIFQSRVFVGATNSKSRAKFEILLACRREKMLRHGGNYGETME